MLRWLIGNGSYIELTNVIEVSSWEGHFLWKSSQCCKVQQCVTLYNEKLFEALSFFLPFEPFSQRLLFIDTWIKAPKRPWVLSLVEKVYNGEIEIKWQRVREREEKETQKERKKITERHSCSPRMTRWKKEWNKKVRRLRETPYLNCH